MIFMIYRKKSKKYDVSKTHDIDVTPNAGYGMIDVVNTTTENEDGVYEKVGNDQVYEQIDEPDPLVAADTSSTSYENTTVPIVKESTSLHESENEEHVYELTDTL